MEEMHFTDYDEFYDFLQVAVDFRSEIDLSIKDKKGEWVTPIHHFYTADELQAALTVAQYLEYELLIDGIYIILDFNL